jgi:ABC-type cobalt transport system substrate-binding protein
LSINGGDPAVVRIRNVDDTGFEIRVQEWDYRDGWHKEERVGYVVMERGTYTLADGSRIEASTFSTDRTNGFEPILFERSFNHTPVIIAAVASVNEADAVTGRMHSVTTDGFMYGMQEQEANRQIHATEAIAYIAWEPSSGEIDGVLFRVDRTGDVINDDFHTISFDSGLTDAPFFLADMQSRDGGDTANIRWQNKTATSVEIQVDEEQSANDETNHTSEVVGYMIFGN